MISLDEIRKLALLARIEMSPSEQKELQKDLGTILDYVSRLKKVPVREIKISETLTNVFRNDEPIEDKSDVKKGEHIKVKHIF
jgi:aspartyl-tRNA(Asn)/glutamyl-tRNA(Gln) amidotransferase subunit C